MAERINKTADHWIETTSNTYDVSVNSLVHHRDGLRKFTIDSEEIEGCLSKVIMVIDQYGPDVLVAVVSVLMVIIARRFKLRIPSMLSFADSYLVSGDRKPASAAIMMMLKNYYDNKVSRHEEVKLSKAVNVTEMMSKSQEQIDEETKVIKSYPTV